VGKGRRADIGNETVNQNGYTCVKTSTGWRFKHHIIAERLLERPLTETERVIFADGDRRNLSDDNIKVVIKQMRVNQTYDKRLDAIQHRMALFVEEAPDAKEALEDLRCQINGLCLAHGLPEI
jgi:hypothetical protein